MKFTPYSLTAKGIKVNIELYLLSTLCGIKRQKKKEFEKGRIFCWNSAYGGGALGFEFGWEIRVQDVFLLNF